MRWQRPYPQRHSCRNSRRAQLCMLVGCGASLLILSGGAFELVPAQEAPTFRSGVRAVEVDVRVTDREGRPIPDLTINDFVLRENGIPQEITSLRFVDLEKTSPVVRAKADAIDADTFTNRGEGRMWVVLLGGFGEKARRVARSFIQEALGPYDQVAIVPVHGTMAAAQGFTRNRRLLLDAIERSGESAANLGMETNRVAFQVLEDVALRLGAFRARRRAILYFDPPGFFQPRGDQVREASVWFQQRDALRAATRNNVAIYVVSTAGLTTELSSPFVPGLDPLKTMAGQRLLAEETGGDAIVNSNNFREGFARFIRESSAYYLLTYTPDAERADSSFQNITLQVARAGVTVRHRRGYYAEESRALAAPAVGEAESRIQEALQAPLAVGGVVIDLFAAPFRDSDIGAEVLLGAHVRGGDIVMGPEERVSIGYLAMNSEGRVTPGAWREARLELSGVARAAVESGGLRILERMRLPKGRHQVRFAVDQPNGRTGMVVADVEVPDFRGASVSMSGLLLSSDLTADMQSLGGDPELVARFPIRPTALRRFSRKDVLTAYAEVYTNPRTNMQNVRVRATISPTEGGATQGLEPTVLMADRDRAVYVVRVPLVDVQENGEHVLTIEAVAGRRSVARRALLTIEPR